MRAATARAALLAAAAALAVALAAPPPAAAAKRHKKADSTSAPGTSVPVGAPAPTATAGAPAPAPAPAPEPAPAPAAAPPAALPGGAPAALAATHDGLHLAGGVAFVFAGGGAAVAARLEGALPVHIAGLPGLAVGLVLNGSYQRVRVPAFGIDFQVVGVTLLPAVQYELALRVAVPGRLSVLFEAGAGPALLWQRLPDQPYMPGYWRANVFFASHLGLGLRFVLANGVLLQVQPIGLDVLGAPGVCDPSGICSGGGIAARYELNVTAGYRF